MLLNAEVGDSQIAEEEFHVDQESIKSKIADWTSY